MSPLETLRTALSALRANRGRSALTVLSITIGAFAIVVMSSLAESGLATLQRGIEEIGGARILMIVQKNPERGEAKRDAYARGLGLAERDRLFGDLPHVVGRTMFSRLGKKEVVSEAGARVTTSVLAVDDRFLDVMRMPLARGEPIAEDTLRSHAPLCIVGNELAKKIGPTPNAPLGRPLTIGNFRCRIAGVLRDNPRFGVRFGFDWNDLVVTPSEAMADVDPDVRARATVFVQTDAPSSNELVKRLVNARLLARHGGIDDFSLYDFSTVMAKFSAIYAAMELIVALLAGIALVVGGVGVMNMMLVAVSERVKEIGIRKALGARPRTIGLQFLTEAALLSTVGGGAGVLAGLVVAFTASQLVVRAIHGWQMSLAPGAAVTALLVSMGLGIAFGWLPAKSAARLDAAPAMRR